MPAPFGHGPPAQTAHHLMSAVAAHLRAVAASRPLVLLVEDLHWADRDAVELLEVATRALAKVPLLVLASYRPEAARRAHPLYDVLPRLLRDRPVECLRLDELGLGAVADLVAARAGPGTPDLAAYLHARTDGHPLFLVELLHDLVERRLLPRDEAGRLLPPTRHVQVPILLRHVVSHRVARLGAETEELLAVAAVAGEVWDLGVVEAVLGWEEERLLRALDRALRSDVVVPVTGEGERYRFRHALIREVLYGEQVARRRRHLHQRVARVLEDDMATDRQVANHAGLAYHFGAAEMWEPAARHAIAAGDEARDRSACHGAVVAYQQALATLARTTPALARELLPTVHERLGQAHLVLGQPEAAEADFRRMLDGALATRDRATEGRGLAWLSYARRRLYSPVGSHDAAVAALAVARDIGEPKLLALANWNLAHVHEIEGDLDRSLRHAAEAERLARGSGAAELLGRSLLVLAQLAIWHGRYADAERSAREALDLARTSHDALALAAAHWRLGIALGEVGRYGQARAVLLSGVAGAEEAGERYYLAKLLNTLGWLHIELGDAEGALRWDREALVIAQGSHGGRVTEAERYSLLNLATDELAAGRLEPAAAHLRAFAPLLEHRDYGRFRYLNRYQLLRSEVGLAQGNREEALRFAAEAGLLAETKAMPKNLAKSRLLEGRACLGLGQTEAAVEALTEATALADRIGHGSLRWQTRLWLGRAGAAAGGDAAPHFDIASAWLHALASAIDDQDLRDRLLGAPLARALEEARTDAPARTAARPAGLTEREVEVLVLLARHQTNNEIAAELFVSPRTVTTHVANIFGKLGVANRRAAAAAAARFGLL
ncbi:MAG: hypothetical protein H0U10_02775 [Chloroflexia bacterium]|nr:hypothetical protein [Chloroflexia bacterium]